MTKILKKMNVLVVGKNSNIYRSIRKKIYTKCNELWEIGPKDIVVLPREFKNVNIHKMIVFAVDKSSEAKTISMMKKLIQYAHTNNIEFILISSAILYVDNISRKPSYSRMKYLQEKLLSESKLNHKILRLGYFRGNGKLPYQKVIFKDVSIILGDRKSVLPSFDINSFLKSAFNSSTASILPVYTVNYKEDEVNLGKDSRYNFYIPEWLGSFINWGSGLLFSIGFINLSNKLKRPFARMDLFV